MGYHKYFVKQKHTMFIKFKAVYLKNDFFNLFHRDHR